jgi:Na+-transporting NADH:ubiquinone oxidoreductase subunit NqrE
MSTSLAGIFAFPEDPRKTEFVLNLLLKTKEGKVRWMRKGNAYTATIPDGISVNFVLGTSIVDLALNWQLFTVRDKADNELIQLSSPGLMSFISPTATGSLLEATNQLFAAVSGLSGDALGKAIESLKQL